MASPVDIAIWIGVLAVGLLGGHGIAKLLDSTSKTEEPKTNSTFSNINIDENSTYHNKLLSWISEENRVFLPKTTDTKNKEWWDWAYKNKYLKISKNKTNLDPIFQNINYSFQKTKEQKSLNQACDEAYGELENRFDETDKTLIKNIGLFCTTGTTPLDLTEPFSKTFKNHPITGYENGLLRLEENRPFIVQTTNPKNQKWWTWNFKNKYNSSQKTTYHPLFQKITIPWSTSPASSETEETALNQACHNAYKKEASEFKDNSLLDNITTFCAINVNKLVNTTNK